VAIGLPPALNTVSEAASDFEGAKMRPALFDSSRPVVLKMSLDPD